MKLIKRPTIWLIVLCNCKGCMLAGEQEMGLTMYLQISYKMMILMALLSDIARQLFLVAMVNWLVCIAFFQWPQPSSRLVSPLKDPIGLPTHGGFCYLLYIFAGYPGIGHGFLCNLGIFVLLLFKHRSSLGSYSCILCWSTAYMLCVGILLNKTYSKPPLFSWFLLEEFSLFALFYRLTDGYVLLLFTYFRLLLPDLLFYFPCKALP